MSGVTGELQVIKDALDKQPDTFQIRRYQATVNKILERDPKNVLALYLKTKLLILSTNLPNRGKITHEVINSVSEMAVLAHNAEYYFRQWELLEELNVNDSDVYQEQRNACENILKTPNTPSSSNYHTIAAKFLNIPPTPIQPSVKPQPPIINPKPEPPFPTNALHAEFIVDPKIGMPPLTAQFTDKSDGNPPLSFHWQFGDGETSHEANPVHTYHNEGDYTVSLTVTNQDGSDETRKTGIIIVTTKKGDHPDSEGIYQKAIVGMVKDYPEIIGIIRAEPNNKIQLKGYVFDAFWGETPKEYHCIINCIDEDIPLTILEKMNDKIQLNAKVETKKLALINKGLSPEFVDWAVNVWKSSLLNEHIKSSITSPPSPTGNEQIIF